MSEQSPDETMEQALQQRLQTLPDAITPARDQWPQIAARLQDDPAQDQPDRSNRWWYWSQALAAVLLVSLLATVVWQQLPETQSGFNDSPAGIGEGSYPQSQERLRRELLQITQIQLQGLHQEWAASLGRLPQAAASAELQAALQAYQLAEQQLQQALLQQPANTSLWQQMSGLQLSRLNMLGVHAR